MNTTLLHRAISLQRTRQFDLLLAQGINVHQKDILLRTPLHIVSDLQDQSLAAYYTKVLLHHGAKTDVKDCDGHTPFYNAVIKQRVKIVKVILREREVDFLECDQDGNIPLHYAAVIGNEALLSLLVKAMSKVGLGIDVRNGKEETALMLAAKHDHVQCQKILIGKSWKTVTKVEDVNHAVLKEDIKVTERFR